MTEANDGLHGFPSPQAEDLHRVPAVWRHFSLFTADHATDDIRTPPGVYQLGVACWGRGGLAHAEHGGGGAGFCFIVLETRPGERLPEMIFDQHGDTRFGTLMVARAGGNAEKELFGRGGDATINNDHDYAITAQGGPGGRGQKKRISGIPESLIVGGGGGASGSFYGHGGAGGNAEGFIYVSGETTFCATSASGGGFGGDGVSTETGGAAPGGGGACHAALSQTLSQGGQPPQIWEPDPGIMNLGLSGAGGGGTCSAGGNGRIQSSCETLSIGATGGSGLNGRGGLGATETRPAQDGVAYYSDDAHSFLALANQRLGGGGGGNADFGDGGHGGPGGGGGGGCAHNKKPGGGGHGGTGGVGGGGGGAAAVSTVLFRGGDSLFGGGGGGSLGVKKIKPGTCFLGGGGQGGYLGDPLPASKGCIILYW